MITASDNLIPAELQQRRMLRKAACFWGAMLLGLFVAVGLYLFREQRLASSRKAILERLEKEAAPAQRVTAQIGMLRGRSEERQRQWERVQDAVRGDDHLQALGVIAASLAESGGSVWLQSVDLNTELEQKGEQEIRPRGRAVLQVRIREDVAAAKFVQSLKQSPRFLDVTLRSTSTSGSRAEREAEITATFAVSGGVL